MATSGDRNLAIDTRDIWHASNLNKSLRQFLEAGDETDWFDQCHTATDSSTMDELDLIEAVVVL